MSRLVRDEHRDTRVRFMLGGAEQIGQGVAGTVPRNDESLASRFFVMEPGGISKSHLPAEPVMSHFHGDVSIVRVSVEQRLLATHTAC